MKRIILGSIAVLLGMSAAKAQSVYQPYSYQFYQKLDANVYSPKTRVHSSIKPYLADDSLLRTHFDSILNYGADPSRKGVLSRLTSGHQAQLNGTNSTFYADVLPDVFYGRDFRSDRNYSQYSVGLQVGGTVGKKLSYNVAGYLFTGQPLKYIDTYINQTGIIPGQAYARVLVSDSRKYNWRYITANISWTPNKYLNVNFGRDKTFIGDGYRSLLLSDYSSPYPFLKFTGTLGNVRYMAMWAQFADPANTSDVGRDRKKWGVFHYLDWNVSNRLSFGFFDSVIWGNEDDLGHPHGFDFNYVNPVIFLRPVEASNGSPDNALIGFTGKYKLADWITGYGQFSLDEFQAKEFFSSLGSSRNKYGFQLGIRGSGIFGVKNLSYLAETNNVKPFTYSERASIINYSANSEPLAHPWGANFREFVAMLNYSFKRWDLTGEVDYGHYGLDINNRNYGKDIFLSYVEPVQANGNYTGQGLTTNMVYLQGKVAYVINPRTNLRIELGGIYRTDKNSQFNDQTAAITFGIRSSFQTLYTDLVRYKLQ